MKILAIETSCDDTGIAILDARKSGKSSHCLHMMANAIQSQPIHTNYGGVFPMMAKREHGKNIVPVFEKALKDAGLYKLKIKNEKLKIDEVKIKKILSRENDLSETFINSISKIAKPKIDAIAVTVGPGLEPALWVGISFAKALSLAWDLPLLPVNHMEGHILSILMTDEGKIPEIQFPALSLLVSGGHTELVLMKDFGKYKVIGQTRDDAAGEAFDKVARMLSLPYPGGPEISKLAAGHRKNSNTSTSPALAGTPQEENIIKLPRPMIHSGDFDFSFSGLKTAVLYLLRDLGDINDEQKKEIACEVEDSIVEVLTYKTIKAIEKYKIQTLIVGGGVSANTHLQKILREKVGLKIKNEKLKIKVYFPTKKLSTDNGLMIAITGYFNYIKKPTKKSPPLSKLKANGNLGF
ncbi:MAG: tRNA (adenosine(37)-N6)-threonylcarbamoyltransferase complex transferase subunit TsaD [Candidatus Pacebacteria bacterium]|nr:tRNA (adenosine(37)-N6)-threonylcarbamoyltransferase complex transferase subunit TsaD [Candidatus Paceibacterota bacterium]MBP9715781.1 tRNA (adenosine(37)-N6)-threonylcarbamoyltransferase complex transferase subunit TsaD [Candidatus Paceibacterota bacterium]